MRYLIAFLSGLFMACSTAPFGAWFLAWIALIPLWLLVFNPKQSWSQVTLQGLLWGLGYHGLTLGWITGLHPLTWMGVPWLTSLAIVLFCWGFITLWGTLAVLGWIWSIKLLNFVFRDRKSFETLWLRVLVGTTLWCAMEWLRSLTPLDWTPLAFTQSPNNLAILHLGQISGPLTVTAVIVAVNGSIAESWQIYREKGWQRQARNLLAIAIAMLIGGHLLGLALFNRPVSDSPQTALEIGIIQGNIPTRTKLTDEGIRQAIANYTAGYQALAEQGVDVVLTPEATLPILWNPINPVAQKFIQGVQTERVPLWLGTFKQSRGKTTQSLLTLDAQGTVFSQYNKIKLVPLGEYIPFENVFGGLISRLSPLSGSLSPGSSDQQFNTPFGKAAVGICYDSTFAELFRHQVKAGGQFILTASNLDPYSATMMAQLHAQEIMRAIESDRWLVRATNTGFSGVINPRGQTIWLSERNSYLTYAATIQRRQTQTPYVRWGNWLTPCLLGGSGVGLFIRKKSKGTSSLVAVEAVGNP